MKTAEYTHHLNSGVGGADVLFLVHFGAPPVLGANEIDNINRKSLHYNELRKERP